HNLHSGLVSGHITVGILDLGGSSDIQSDGSVKFKGVPSSGCFRISEHNTDLLSQLVDKDHTAVGFADRTGEFSQGLRHQTGVKPHFRISHFSFDLTLGRQGRYRVDHNNINGSGTDQVISNLKGLLSVIRLRDDQVFQVNSQLFSIGSVKSVLGIDKGGNASFFVSFRYGM